ncbi:MAG: ABC transporter ATP-binding protein, partial [Candidatus Woesearchaeota archaeon]
GEFLGIVGPNGSGKTTLIRSITKVLEPNQGKIRINGKKLADMDRSQISKIISVVPQDSFISFPFKTLDIVLMGRSPYKGRFDSMGDKDREIAEKYMRLTDTWQFRDKKVNQLSGGEIQRVSIARALVQNSKILLMDEPTSHLDLNYEFKVLSLIQDLKKNDLTIISVFHDLNLASRFCDRIIILKKGKIFANGEPKKVLSEENVSRVYGSDVVVKRNPRTGNPYVIPITNTPKNSKNKDHNIHVICGGGSGSKLLNILIEKSYKPSVGVINVLDSDYKTANSLNLEIVTEAPFSPISSEAFEQNKKLIKNSQTVILTDVSFGKGNLKNLKSIKETLKDQKLIIIEKRDIEERDYTNEEAKKIYKKLKKEAKVTYSANKAISKINDRSKT